MELPDDLRTALENELQHVDGKDIVRAADRLSKRYRERHGRSSTPFLESPLDAIAYAAYRLPATYAAVAAVLREVRARRPDLVPRSLLDIGAGPGTAMWAALEIWPELERMTALERDASMIRLGKNLTSQAAARSLRGAVWKGVDLTAPLDEQQADITIAAYVLGEIPVPEHAQLVRRLWESTGDTCVVVEPGTPRGFSFSRQAGEQLTAMGAHIVAPFPASWNCLAADDDWCHFSQRVPRTPLLRLVKDARLSYEDEKYSYVAASRIPGLPIAARVVRHPQVRSGHIRLTLCTQLGIKEIVVSRSNREAYRRAHHLTWGSAILREEAHVFGLPDAIGDS